MKSIGKTYLIKIEKPKEEKYGDIILPETAANIDLIHYIGRIYDYGIGFTEEEKKDLIPIGTKVIMDWHKETAQNKIKLVMGDSLYYVYEPKHILAIIEEVEK